MAARSNHPSELLLLLGLALAALSCTDATAPDAGGDLEIRASVHGPALQQSGPGLGIQIERILVVVGRVKLEKAGATLRDFVDDRSVVIELDPGLAPVLVLSAEVPEGEFKELEIAVDKLEPGHPQEQRLIDSHPALRDASVLIEGQVVGAGGAEPFRFVTDLDIDLELTFEPPLRIGTAGGPTTLVSLILDATQWFRAVSGSLLDPRDPANRSAIEGNVQKSIEVFEGPVFLGG